MILDWPRRKVRKHVREMNQYRKKYQYGKKYLSKKCFKNSKIVCTFKLRKKNSEACAEVKKVSGGQGSAGL